MSSIIIGLPKPRLARRLFFREPIGLERIQEEYVYSGKSFGDFLLNGVQQTSISSMVIGDGNLYPNMTIERVEFQSLDGDLTRAFVTYVGLYTTQIPKPIISIEPIIDRNWLFHNYAAIIKFVRFIGPAGSQDEINLVSNIYKRGTIHFFINNTPIPIGIKGPGAYDVITPGLQWNLGWIGCPFTRSSCYPEISGEGEPPINNRTDTVGSISYSGFSVFSVSFERFGLYGVFKLDIRDQAVYSIAGITDSCGNVPFSLPMCVSYLNTPASANPIS